MAEEKCQEKADILNSITTENLGHSPDVAI